MKQLSKSAETEGHFIANLSYIGIRMAMQALKYTLYKIRVQLLLGFFFRSEKVGSSACRWLDGNNTLPECV